MNLAKTERQPQEQSPQPEASSRKQSRKSSAMPILSLLVVASLLLALPSTVASSFESSPADAQAENTLELFVAPHQSVKLDCKIPTQAASNEGRFFYWSFQRPAKAADKPRILCYETKCMAENSLGIQLFHDSQTGAYDLYIQNATYESHNGLYYCDYSLLAGNQSVDRRFRLTVLSK